MGLTRHSGDFSTAACLNRWGLFHPADTDSDAYENAWYYGPEAKEAQAVCNEECPIKALCLKTFINEHHGIFGGTTPVDRLEMRREDARS